MRILRVGLVLVVVAGWGFVQGGCARSSARTERVATTAPARTTTAPADAAAGGTAAPPPARTPGGASVIGLSVRGRPIEAVTLGGSGRRVLLIGGIHGDEPEGGRTIEAVVAYLHRLEPGAQVRVVRDANPDGTAARSRTNARGVDLNRNWPARNFRPGSGRGPSPLSEPETRALHEEIERFGPELVVVCHSARSGPFVNFDGPAASEAAAFASAASQSDSRWRIVPDMGYPTPGSLGSFMGVDRGVPILTIEFERGHEPGAAWVAMRDGMAALLGREPLAK